MRHKLTISYDGRAFAGWQSQPRKDTVQDVMEKALERIAKAPIRLHSAGRTDTGVHALAQTAHFDAPDGLDLSPEDWIRAFNAYMPPHVRVLRCEPAAADWHARFDATGKLYRYRVCQSPILQPLEYGLSCHLPHHLDRETLAKVCSLCCGRHDFTAFAASRGDGRESEPGYAVRTIWSVDSVWDGEFLTITFFGEGFLYKMVRLLVGAMLRVAQHRETIEWFADYLHQPNGRRTSYVAPAGGLYLVEVRYEPVTPP